MNPDVSRVLATVKAELNLDREQVRELVAKYGEATSVDDLPSWMTDFYRLDNDPDPGT